MVCYCALLLSASVCAKQQSTDDNQRLAFPSPLNEQDIVDSDAEALLAHVKQLLVNSNVKPQNVLADAQLILAHASKIGAPELEVEAASIVIASSATTNRRDEVDALVEEYLPQAINLDAKVAQARIYRTLLRFANTDNDNSRVVAIKRHLMALSKQDLPAIQEGRIYLSIGISDFFSNRYYSALKSFERAQDIFTRNESQADNDRVLSMLALVNSRLGNERRAINIQERIAERLRTKPKNISWSIVDYNIASAYFDLREYEQANVFARRSKSVALDFDDKASIAYADLMLARIAEALDEYDSAKRLATKSANEFERMGDKNRQAQSLVVLIKSDIKLGAVDTSEAYLNTLSSILSESSDPALNAALLEVSSMISQANGSHELALTQYKQFFEAMMAEERQLRARSIEAFNERFGDGC